MIYLFSEDYMQAAPEVAPVREVKADRDFVNRAMNRQPAATPVGFNHVQEAERNR